MASQVSDNSKDPELSARAVRGSVIVFARYGGVNLLRFAANLIATRQLTPEAYGLTALVSVLMIGLDMLSDIGLGPSIIRSKRGDDPVFLDTLWTVQLVRGTLCWLVGCALARPFAAFYEEPQLADIIPVATSVALISSLAPLKRFTLNRELAFGRLTLVDLGAQAIGLGVQIALAYQWHSVWALVWGSLANSVFGTLFEHLFLPGRSNGFRFERAARKELFGFGRWLFVSTMLTFFSQATDRLILGKLSRFGRWGFTASAGSWRRPPPRPSATSAATSSSPSTAES